MLVFRKINKSRSKSFPWTSDHPEQELPKTPCNTRVREDQAGNECMGFFMPLQVNVKMNLFNKKNKKYLCFFCPALNATVAVQRLKSRQTYPDVNQSTSLVNQVLNPELASSQSG